MSAFGLTWCEKYVPECKQFKKKFAQIKSWAELIVYSVDYGFLKKWATRKKNLDMSEYFLKYTETSKVFFWVFWHEFKIVNPD